MKTREPKTSGLIDAITAWVNRWMHDFPDPAWDVLLQDLQRLSTTKAHPEAYPKCIGRWLKRNDAIAGKIDRVVAQDRQAVRAFELERNQRPNLGKYSRKSVREGRDDA